MRVRAADFPEDLPLVQSLFEEYAKSLHVSLCFQNFGEELATLPGRYAAPLGGLWIAEIEKEPVGCIALRPLPQGRAELKRLYVRPGHRGLKIGEKLTRHAIEAALEKGFQWVCLDTLPSMEQAIALYLKLGFREIEPYYSSPVPGALFFDLQLS